MMVDTVRKRWRASAAVQDRARQLRRPLTPAEEKLWQRLRNGQILGLSSRRQHPVDRFIADFYCPAAKLVLEVDGDSHARQADYDAERTRWLGEPKQYQVMRFTNDEVFQNVEAVLDAIAAVLRRPPP